MDQRFKGTGVALVTPFKNGKIDFDALEKVIEYVISGGVDFLVSLGTTGESVTLTSEEQRKILDFTIRTNRGRLPIVAGNFGGSNTAAQVEKIRNFNFDGIDVIMVSSPAYNKPSQEGIYQHYMQLAEVSPLPIIIYNVPGRTAKNIEAKTTLRLAHASEKFMAVKEASADMVQCTQILKNRPENFLVLSGDDPTTLPLIGTGGDGVISVIANAFPKEFSNMTRTALKGDYPRARKLNNLLLDIHPWLYIDGNPAGIKAALEILGFCSREVRLPLTSISSENFNNLKQEISNSQIGN